MKDTKLRKSLQKIKKELNRKQCKTPPLSPIELFDTSAPACFCLDGNGEYKILYPTLKEAEAICNNQRDDLRIYPCPSNKGWHLTKR